MEDQNKNLMENESSLREREKRAREYSYSVAKRNTIRKLIIVFVIIAIVGVLFIPLHGLFERGTEVLGYENTPTTTSTPTPSVSPTPGDT